MSIWHKAEAHAMLVPRNRHAQIATAYTLVHRSGAISLVVFLCTPAYSYFSIQFTIYIYPLFSAVAQICPWLFSLGELTNEESNASADELLLTTSSASFQASPAGAIPRKLARFPRTV